MADLDDLREGANFGLDIASQQQHFHVKGAENAAWVIQKKLHLHRGQKFSETKTQN